MDVLLNLISANTENTVVKVCVCVFQPDLGPRPEVQRKGPVTMEEWTKYQDSEGRMTNVSHIKELIFKGVRLYF